MERKELEKHMRRLGVNAMELADELGVTPNAVWRWLNESRQMSETTARLIRKLEPKTVKT